MTLYKEAPETGNSYREAFLRQFELWLDRAFADAEARRATVQIISVWFCGLKSKGRCYAR